jgi:hypothetical protein
MMIEVRIRSSFKKNKKKIWYDPVNSIRSGQKSSCNPLTFIFFIKAMLFFLKKNYDLNNSLFMTTNFWNDNVKRTFLLQFYKNLTIIRERNL